MLSNDKILNDDNTKRHADRVHAVVARPPPSGGKPIFDIFLNKQVGYEMPRHFLSTHSQHRIRGLDSYDEILLSEFLHGYVAMTLCTGIDNVTAEAMVQCFGMLGEALIDYQWHDIRDWMNAILHEVDQGRISWRDHKYIADRLNATKMRASMRTRLFRYVPNTARVHVAFRPRMQVFNIFVYRAGSSPGLNMPTRSQIVGGREAHSNNLIIFRHTVTSTSKFRQPEFG